MFTCGASSVHAMLVCAHVCVCLHACVHVVFVRVVLQIGCASTCVVSCRVVLCAKMAKNR